MSQNFNSQDFRWTKIYTQKGPKNLGEAQHESDITTKHLLFRTKITPALKILQIFRMWWMWHLESPPPPQKKTAHSCPITLNNSYNGVTPAPGTGMVQSQEWLGRAGGTPAIDVAKTSYKAAQSPWGAAPALWRQIGKNGSTFWCRRAGTAPISL